MSTEFWNPYHFIPLENADALGKRTDASTFREKRNGEHLEFGHAKYHSGRLSGRIVCKLTVETPLVLGGRQIRENEKTYALVEPYRFRGRPAIPGTSLRGLISSIVEAASGSAMRVLANQRPLSYRKAMGEALHALGMIVQEGDHLGLRPLTLPLMRKEDRASLSFRAKPSLWSRVFANSAILKVHIGDYRRGRGEAEFTRSLRLVGTAEPPLSREPIFYAAVRSGAVNGNRVRTDAEFHELHGQTVIGQLLADQTRVLTEEEYRTLEDRGDYVRGLIRVLGSEWREDDIPNKKKHELFIPFPENECGWNPLLKIPDHVVSTFNALARERAETTAREDERRKQLPFLPFGPEDDEKADRHRHGDVLVPRLREGQIVYFDVEAGADGEPEVSEISFSAIWRSAVMRNGEVAELDDFFHHELDPELLPYHNQRNWLTPAERLFGFVAEGRGTKSNGEETTKSTRAAFAGRFRFSLGQLSDGVESESVFGAGEQLLEPEAGEHKAAIKAINEGRYTRLRILASPKPPSPNLYFKRRDGSSGAITKSNLNVDADVPQGRKMYLHHPVLDKKGDVTADAKKGLPWPTRKGPPGNGPTDDKTPNQKNAVKPLKPGTSFWFHVDFDDLEPQELQLLCFALHPSDDFRHKLGMGKPLGLGSVRIEPQGLFLIDRCKRYTVDGFKAATRYTRIVLEHDVKLDSWPDAYARERDEARSATATANGVTGQAASYLQPRRDHPAIKALLAIGETPTRASKLIHPVHTPLVEAQDEEDETFKWFVQNASRDNQRNRQQLKPIADRIGTLYKHPPLEMRFFLGRGAPEALHNLYFPILKDYYFRPSNKPHVAQKNLNHHVTDRRGTQGTSSAKAIAHQLQSTVWPANGRPMTPILIGFSNDLQSAEECKLAKRIIFLNEDDEVISRVKALLWIA